MALSDLYQEIPAQEAVKGESKKIEKADGRVKLRVRLIPIWLRIIIVIVLFLLSTAAGLVTGYSGIGSGKASDTFDKATWTHILDLVNKE
ncbi:DNA-directed RNA polymerase subunit beta [Mesobacillus zeae]|uniref:DNA-directed RNA polymerase subunit beta n=1 Tax=Mesobacillus zeae TaxID=1917180 RepID=A0A398B1C2_9BACI|nr:DNA-directed RNA polymerase subunit beta [Mesobacillus zeae]RID83471.1 DNA-directed RNA polymerase subunit beta [Mesobacillus zeae]